MNFHLESLINCEELSDVCFIIYDNHNAKDGLNLVNDHPKKIYANKAILAYNSPVFKAMLYGYMEEGKPNPTIEIVDIPYDIFYFIIEYIYTGSMRNIKEGMCIPILYAAKKYQLLTLHQRCSNMFLTNVSCESVYNFINALSSKNPWSHQDEIKDLCLKFIELNGDEFITSDQFKKLPKDVVLDIVRSPMLSTSSEILIFNAVINWINYNLLNNSKFDTKIIKNDIAREMLYNIRYTNMTVIDILSYVKKYNIFSSTELINILECISLDSPLMPGLIINTELRQHPTILKYNFSHKTPFDRNGVIYAMGSNDHEKEFEDPSKNDFIRICTTDTGSTYKSHKITTSRNFNTKGWIGSGTRYPNDGDTEVWISIDLGTNRKIRLTDYSLFHSYHTSLDSLRSWKIEGCNPGQEIGHRIEEKEIKENDRKMGETYEYTPNRLGKSYIESHLDWMCIDERKDDTSLNYGWAKKSWKIENPRGDAFRMIRIRLTGPDSSGTQYMTIGGIELYGTLFIYQNKDPGWDY